MREIKFKAKRVSDGEWVESASIQNNPFGKTYLMDTNRLVECYNKEVMPSNIWVEIDPNTLCQFTGLIDKNGKEVYEGDIVRYTIGVPYEEIDDISATVIWSVEDARYMLVNDEEYINEEFDIDTCTNSEVIGNIHNK